MGARGFIKTLAVLAASAAIWPLSAEAQQYPARAVTVIVPFSAGGSFDVVGRIITARMQEIMGQAVIVENVGGSGGTVGVKRVIAAEPDGYTVLFGTVGTHAYNQWIYKKRRYDATTDLAPVTLFSEQPMVLVAREGIAVDTMPDFTALLKAKGDKMQFGSAGVGSTTHLGCALVNSRLGLSITHVPYRGGGPAMNDLLAGNIDYFCGNLGGYVPQIVAGKVRAIALLSKERSPLMPDLKTAHEQGITELNVVTWTAFFVPKGTPRPIVDKLLEVTHAAMEHPETKKRMLEIGVTGVGPERRSPEYLARFVTEEIDRWKDPIVGGGLQQE